jgi:hypothetical protein
MGLLEIIKNIVSGGKKIDTSKLPTQGYFYPNDFDIKIKKAQDEDIIDYEFNFDKENIISVIESVKKIVKNNTTFGNGYKFEDLKSVDIVYLFLEIVKYTKSKKILIDFFNDDTGTLDKIEFCPENFKYFDLKRFKDLHNSETCDFFVDGYRFSMPSIGVENSMTQYLLSLADEPDTDRYNDYSYDFLFFLGKKNNLNFDEVENLITIFNFDIDEEEKKKIKSIINKFIEIVGYNLNHKNLLIDIKSNVDLENIWQ